MTGKVKIVVGVTGASGALYARLLLERLNDFRDQYQDCGIIFSDNALKVWNYELDEKVPDEVPWKIYKPDDFYAPMASGSAGFNKMIICPCTMGTLGRIASGMANDLITRAADVILKEKGSLILVIREMPYNLIHIRNMKILAEAGAILCPAAPSFYSKPQDIRSLTLTVVDKALTLAGISVPGFRWQEPPEED